MTANPGHVALLCVAAGALTFEAFDLETGNPITTWEQYAEDSSIIACSWDDIPLESPGDCERYMLVWLPEDATSVGESVGEANPSEIPKGCGKFITWRGK